MATVYLSPTGDDTRTYVQAQNRATPWLSMGHAASNISANDEVVLLAGTYDAAVDPEHNDDVDIAVDGTLWRSDSEDATTVEVIHNSNRYWIDCAKGLTSTTFKGITFTNNSTTGTYAVVFRGSDAGSGAYSVMNIHDCIINSKEVCIQNAGIGSTIDRCQFHRVAGGNGTYIRGIWSQNALSSGYRIDSCLMTGWYKYAIYHEDTGVNMLAVRNCTIIGSPSSTSGDAIHLNGTTNQISNTIVYSYAAGDYKYGIEIYPAHATKFVSHCIVYGTYATAETRGTGAPTQTTQLEGQGDVTASGKTVVQDLAAGNYTPTVGGLADGRGQTTLPNPATDLNGNSYASPPSIGCIELNVPAGGGGPSGKVTLGIRDKFPHLNNIKF